MKFVISRTSEWSDEVSPHPLAKRELCEYWHIRTCDENEYNKKFSGREGLWRSKGKNHTVNERGYVKRQESDREQWVIELNTFEDVIKLSEECEIIISPISEEYNLPKIELYDSYRE